MRIVTERINDKVLFTIHTTAKEITFWLELGEAVELATTLILQASAGCDELDHIPDELRPACDLCGGEGFTYESHDDGVHPAPCPCTTSQARPEGRAS